MLPKKFDVMFDCKGVKCETFEHSYGVDANATELKQRKYCHLCVET